MKKILLIVVVLLILSVAFSGILLSGCANPDSGSGPATEYGPEVGKLAPDFTLTGLDGQEVSLSDFRGKPVLINFWASWCGPCRIEMPFLQEVYEEWNSKGLVVLAVNLQENRIIVEKFAESMGLTFPILLSPGSKIPLSYNVRGIPATFLIDVDGVIRDIKIGAFSGVGEIESKLAKIMP